MPNRKVPFGRIFFSALTFSLLFLGLNRSVVQAAEMVIFYSNDVHGETDPCG